MNAGRVVSWIAASIRNPGAGRLARALSCSLAMLALAFSSMSSQASPTDCIGTSVDGKAKCSAPVLSGYTYEVCNVSQLFVGIAVQAECDWYALGVQSYADPDGGWDPGPSVTTFTAQLNAFITCMRGTAPPVWAHLGEQVGSYWCPVAPVTNKYGVEVIGASEGIADQYSGLVVQRTKTATCPFGTNAVGNNSSLPDYCVAVPKCTCEVKADPMGIVNGDQNLAETDIPPYSESPLEFSRSYSSSAYYRPVNAAKISGPAYLSDGQNNAAWDLTPGFGDYWRHTYSGTVMVENQPNLDRKSVV